MSSTMKRDEILMNMLANELDDMFVYNDGHKLRLFKNGVEGVLTHNNRSNSFNIEIAVSIRRKGLGLNYGVESVFVSRSSKVSFDTSTPETMKASVAKTVKDAAESARGLYDTLKYVEYTEDNPLVAVSGFGADDINCLLWDGFRALSYLSDGHRDYHLLEKNNRQFLVRVMDHPSENNKFWAVAFSDNGAICNIEVHGLQNLSKIADTGIIEFQNGYHTTSYAVVSGNVFSLVVRRKGVRRNFDSDQSFKENVETAKKCMMEYQKAKPMLLEEYVARFSNDIADTLKKRVLESEFVKIRGVDVDDVHVTSVYSHNYSNFEAKVLMKNVEQNGLYDMEFTVRIPHPRGVRYAPQESHLAFIDEAGDKIVSRLDKIKFKSVNKHQLLCATGYDANFPEMELMAFDEGDFIQPTQHIECTISRIVREFEGESVEFVYAEDKKARVYAGLRIGEKTIGIGEFIDRLKQEKENEMLQSIVMGR